MGRNGRKRGATLWPAKLLKCLGKLGDGRMVILYIRCVFKIISIYMYRVSFQETFPIMATIATMRPPEPLALLAGYCARQAYSYL